MNFFFSSYNFFYTIFAFLVIKTLDPDWYSALNAGSGSGINESGIETRILILFISPSRAIPGGTWEPTFVYQGDLVCCGVLSGNRNFEGRIHPNTRANYLASPLFVIGQPHSYNLHQRKLSRSRKLTQFEIFVPSFPPCTLQKRYLNNRRSTTVSRPKFICSQFSLRRAVFWTVI
jgi:hypothetical protein